MLDENIDNTNEDIVDDLSYDVYNLTASNYHPVRLQSNSEDLINKQLMVLTQRATQLLVKRLTLFF